MVKEFFINWKNLILTCIKYLVYFGLVVSLFLLLIEHLNVQLSSVNIENVIQLIVSATAITVAILVTFFFSKLFAERQDRIQRKVLIDEYSKKVTALRRIAFRIRRDQRLWNGREKMKSLLDTKYSSLTLKTFRSHQTYTKLTSELGAEMAAMAYLSLRDFEDGQDSWQFYTGFKVQNYSLEEIAKYSDYCRCFWSFCDEYKSTLSFEEKIHEARILEDYMIIKGISMNQADKMREYMDLFGDFFERIFQELAFLTQLNQRKLPTYYSWISVNLIVYTVLLIGAVSLSILPFCAILKSGLIVFSVSLLIVNTIDLIFNLFYILPRELSIKTFYRI